jgi:hypothetical protein
LCDILNYVIQETATDYGYAQDLNDVIFKTLTYSLCLLFPREVWHTEYQAEDGEDGEEKEVLQKEGIRYFAPHPVRMFWDLHYNIATLNTDTGCQYAGYWKVVPYSDILDNPSFWNRRSIGYGAKDWLDPLISTNFLSEVFPCNLQFPIPLELPGQATNREAAAVFYASDDRDKAVFQTDIYMKLVPKKWKLGSYKHPIWIRFIVASDSTVIFAEPCCYNPVLYCGYDADAMRSRNSSLALEVLPFQDCVGNVLSQILLTCKQNLANVNFYDKTVLDKEDVDKVKNGGEMLYRGLNFVEFDSQKNVRMGSDVKQAIYPVTFPYKDPTPLFNSLNTLLAILERLLQLSAQESGSAASHQQSAKEVEQIGSSTSNRVQFTGSFIDSFLDAWKRQQYEAHQAYADDGITAYVDSSVPDIEEHLQDLGFHPSGQIKAEGKIRVSGSKKKLRLDAIKMTAKGPDDKTDSQTAQVMMQAATAVGGNKELAQAVGPKPILKIIEQAAHLAGMDKDTKFRVDEQQEANQLQQMAQQITMTAIKKVEQDVTKPVADAMAKIEQDLKQLQQTVITLAQKTGVTPAQPTGQQAPPAAPAPQAAPIPPQLPPTPPPNAAQPPTPPPA